MGVSAADLEVTSPLLYSFVGGRQAEGKQNPENPGLVATKPSSYIALREATAGSVENVHRFILQFQCKSEGKFQAAYSMNLALSTTAKCGIFLQLNEMWKGSQSSRYHSTLKFQRLCVELTCILLWIALRQLWITAKIENIAFSSVLLLWSAAGESVVALDFSFHGFRVRCPIAKGNTRYEPLAFAASARHHLLHAGSYS